MSIAGAVGLLPAGPLHAGPAARWPLRAGPLRADPLRTLARCALARCVLAAEQQGCINKLANNGPMLCLDISEFATGFVHGETNQFT